ncbi:BglI family type II restriction endonuclease [Sporosarcina highlanderae]|uniref:BglI family type II restriction endonuclease n=1 Tax=Sporosarcina highlanderae TaxID=3035916 RepID=A0ABT8JQ85_9BACL|nr:BglI family type II restriction endonuclease [Sporosarcina highlanderae]MDN4607182.1 BglI family type II restriction endonuclease [Sporosarcina highlanderae]
MYNLNRSIRFKLYHQARSHYITNFQELINLEKFVTNKTVEIIKNNLQEFVTDYNEASFLHPYWALYPPEDRGRKPKGDQIPWIEVGEHAIGRKLSRLIGNRFTIREVGLPAGPDDRFLLISSELKNFTNFTDCVMFFSDIKSVGPRDDAENIVLSPYQVSGDGLWNAPNHSVYNNVMHAVGSRASHDFWPAIPPLYILSDNTVAPVLHIYLKPIYKMLSIESKGTGQPLEKIRVICVPNGLLLTENPNYLSQYPKLFFPGKDDKSKASRKLRCRVSFDILKTIHPWRVQDIII